MEEKLEKLSRTNRRLASAYPNKETEYEDGFIDRIAFYETEDRKNGNIPFYKNNVQRITEFYEGKDILITGGTGFVGKVLIEKILRSLPKGGRIFLLIRSRRGLKPQQRIKAMLGLPIFKLLMSENPKAAERLVVIEGDCGALGLGLSQADRQTIIDNVSIVFHCAATVRFDLPFSFVATVNTRGTREMVQLVKDLKKLDAFVYVSTAFTGATRDRTTPIPEEVIPAGVDWRTVIKAADKSIEGSKTDGFDLIFEKLKPQFPTNYTFCKLLAENLVEEECKGMPVVIVRPSILTATYEDPFGGWIDNLYGPFSLWDAIGRGIVRVLYGNDEISPDSLPVDVHVKTVISAAWHRGLGFRMRYRYHLDSWFHHFLGESGSIMAEGVRVISEIKDSTLRGAHGGCGRRGAAFMKCVFAEVIMFTSPLFRSDPDKVDVVNNCTSSVVKKSFKESLVGVHASVVEVSHKYIFRYPRVLMTSHYWLFWLITVTSHLPMGLLMDTALKLSGEKPLFLNVYRRIFFNQTRFIVFFCSKDFKFDGKWMFTMDARMPKVDKDCFSWGSKVFEFAYLVDNFAGVIEYVFKEKPVPGKQSNLKIMYIVDCVHTAILVGLGLWLISWMIYR